MLNRILNWAGGLRFVDVDMSFRPYERKELERITWDRMVRLYHTHFDPFLEQLKEGIIPEEPNSSLEGIMYLPLEDDGFITRAQYYDSLGIDPNDSRLCVHNMERKGDMGLRNMIPEMVVDIVRNRTDEAKARIEAYKRRFGEKKPLFARLRYLSDFVTNSGFMLFGIPHRASREDYVEVLDEFYKYNLELIEKEGPYYADEFVKLYNRIAIRNATKLMEKVESQLKGIAKAKTAEGIVRVAEQSLIELDRF